MNSLRASRLLLRPSRLHRHLRTSPTILPILRNNTNSTSITPTLCQTRFASSRDPNIAELEKYLDQQESSKRGRLPPRNPLDEKAQQEYERQRSRQNIRDQLRLATYALICMAMPFVLIRVWPGSEQVRKDVAAKKAADAATKEKEDAATPSIIPRDRMDAGKDADATFAGKPVIVNPGTHKITAPDPSNPNEEVELVETGTSYVPHFPKTVSLPSDAANARDAEYTLVGLGIRRVSFLNIQVYVVGFYVKNSALQAFQSALTRTVNPTASALILGEKETLRASLLDADQSWEVWDQVLRDRDGGGHIDTLFRVVPVRDTDFNHLRDGWVTGITNRIQEDAKRRQKIAKEAANGVPPPPAEFDDESMGLAMRSFKSLFSGKGKAPKASIILLERTPQGSLEAWFQRSAAAGSKKGGLEKIGSVEDERVSRLIWMGYLGGKNVSSEEARKDVVKGIMGFVERPAGTVEGMVV